MIQIDGTDLAKVMHYYGLLESENEYKIVCPFHDDVNASMKINLNDGSFYCFGCGLSGDALKFVQLVNKKMNPLQACKELQHILHSKTTKKIKVKPHTKTVQESKQALVEAEDYFFGLKQTNWFKTDDPAKNYMIKRGFTTASLNLCKARLSYNQSYPIIFPMFDLNEFKGWVCRTTNKKVEQKRKYLYNTGFSRRNTLVGNYNSKTVVLVEGFMDYLKMRQNGLHKVAAILGWKITEQQITKLKNQGVKCIISALDNDKCGIAGTEYLQKFFNVVRFQYPEGVKDPGDMDQKTFNKAFLKTKKVYRRTQKHGNN